MTFSKSVGCNGYPGDDDPSIVDADAYKRPRFCCGIPEPHCHCGGDKGHSILPGCPGYVEKKTTTEPKRNFLERLFDRIAGDGWNIP